MAFGLPTLVLLCVFVAEITGHGMMMDPPNRSSLWRVNPKAPKNYDDNTNWCGGIDVQWKKNGGKCGICGDPFGGGRPQPNENGGRWGRGIIAKSYKAGSVINTQITLTQNHRGYFLFSLCTLNNPNAPESGESCFQPLKLANGQARYNVNPTEKNIKVQLRLPAGKKCNRCVLRWHYTTGNNWGKCSDGRSALGCGPQETFRNCADISIY